jgi:MbtH protein
MSNTKDQSKPDDDARADWQSGPLRVVVNLEEQYSIWPLDRELPAGWSETGKCGTKEECIRHIEEVWTDMRPKSLRLAMESESAGKL